MNITNWQFHRSNGGTGLTRTSGKDTAEIQQSVEEFGSAEFFMKGSELHTTRNGDCSDFWSFHYARHPRSDP